MKKILFIAFASLALLSCKKDDPKPSGFTNSYTYDGVTTAVKWGGFYYDAENDLYAVSICGNRPTGDLMAEEEFVTFKVPGALMNTTVDVTDIYDDALYPPYYFMACFGYHGELYIRQEGDFMPEGIDSGNFTITRTGNTKQFTVNFTLNLNNGKSVSGNYRGSFQEGEEYGDIGIIIPLSLQRQ